MSAGNANAESRGAEAVAPGLNAIGRSPHDLAIIGGGINGLVLALEAAGRGLRTILLERARFGRATSANSLRIVHGGLRYLQHLDVRRFMESVRDRRWFLRTFPQHVEPLRCLMPLYDEGLHRRILLRPALILNDALSAGRNRDVREDRTIPGSRLLDPRAARELYPGADVAGLRGAALWHDAVIRNPAALFAAIADAARAAGAELFERTEVIGLRSRDGDVEGIEVIDREADERRFLLARSVVNCAGPWSREVSCRLDREFAELMHPTIAFNLVVDRALPASTALAVRPRRAARARTYFLHEDAGGTLAGTWHAPWSGPPHVAAPPDSMIAAMLTDLNAAMPGWKVEAADIRETQVGLITGSRPGAAEPARHAVVIDHGRRGGPRGLLSVSGVKLSTARSLARRVLRHVRNHERHWSA